MPIAKIEPVLNRKPNAGLQFPGPTVFIETPKKTFKDYALTCVNSDPNFPCCKRPIGEHRLNLAWATCTELE